MQFPPMLSLLVPSRGRPDQLARFLASVAATVESPHLLEIVLVLDEDDGASATITHPNLRIVRAIGPAGRRMGQLNQDGYRAARGRYVMLLNDDVIVRTAGWDRLLAAHLAAIPDEVVLLHVNDTLMRHHLCTFPLVSRFVCEQAGGICPEEYERYRIDDHLEDIFNLLAALGERRTIHLPEVVFEHLNAVTVAEGVREYHADPEILARDSPRFDALFPQRKAVALRLLEHIETQRTRALFEMKARQLESLKDPFALRVPERMRVELNDRPALDAPVTLLVLSSRPGKPLRRAGPGREYLVVECPHPSAAVLNRALAACRTDLVAVVTAPHQATGQLVEHLLAELRAGVGMVLARSAEEDATALALGSPCFLLDRQRCRPRLFEEGYTRYFHLVDYCLRLQEAGLRVATTGTTGMDWRHGQRRVERVAFLRDRERFLAQWDGTHEATVLTSASQEVRYQRETSLTMWLARQGARLRARYHQGGSAGLLHAAWRRLVRSV